jgi:hypothetical protein
MSTETEDNARMYVHLMIAAFVLVVFIAGVQHILPYDTPAVSMPAVIGLPITIQPPAPADCLPSGNGAPCIPFDKIQEMMDAQPDAPEPIPANPAAANEEKI